MPFTAWPATSKRAEPHPVEDGPEPGTGPFAGPRWLLVWNRDFLGECCCPRGTVRRNDDGRATGTMGNCQRPGKHPWSSGFEHGAADALEYAEVIERYGLTGNRQLAVVLDDLLVVDLDSPRALRDFARLSFTVPRQRILAVSTSPRGYHVWLDAPGWNQKALNDAMAAWLAPHGGWSGTDEAKAGLRGFLVDVRTGQNRYVVWPGQHPARRWISLADFTEVIRGQLYGMPAWRMVETGAHDPLAVDTSDPAYAEWIASRGTGAAIEVTLRFDGSAEDIEFAWAELERWIARLEIMGAKTGRNNMLNAVAYYTGSQAILAGHDHNRVRNRLVEAGKAIGTHGVEDTVNSGLNAGIATLKKQRGAH